MNDAVFWQWVVFAAVVAVSPAVWTSYEAMMLGPRDAFDDAADFARHDVIAHADRLAGTDLLARLGRERVHLSAHDAARAIENPILSPPIPELIR